MKKLICLSLALLMLSAPALAEPAQPGEAFKDGHLNVTIQSAGVAGEWHGQASTTHAWIVVELTAQTFKHRARPAIGRAAGDRNLPGQVYLRCRAGI